MNISQITDAVYVGAQPGGHHAEALDALGVRLIISMRGEVRPPEVFGRPPFELLWLRTFDTFFTPIPQRVLYTGVQAALAAIEAGGRVLIHCHYGRHRSVALAAAVLIAQGQTAPDAMRLLRERRAEADPDIWYIRRQIEKFARAWPPAEALLKPSG